MQVSKPMCFSSFLAKRTHPRQRQPHYSTPLRSSSSSPALPPHHRSPPTQSSGRHVVPRSAPTASRQVTTSSRGLSSTFASPEASQRKLRATATSPPPPAITTAALSISDNDAEEDDGTPTPEEVAQTLEEKLTQIVGMKPIKDMLRALMLDIQMNLLREQMIEENESISAPHNAEHRHQFQQTPHLLLLGNPGTGKTTIARIIGNLLHKLGVVNSPLFVEVSRESLVAGYIGKTAEKTLAEIEKARGGMMFVDEAYRLVPSSGTSSNDFGREALETIMTEMTRQQTRDRTVVFAFAGYTQHMSRVLATNPGIKSRIAYTFELPDYTPADLAEMTAKLARAKGFIVGCDLERLEKIVAETPVQLRTAYNGRLAEKLVVGSRMTINTRASLASVKTKELLFTITEEDFRAAAAAIVQDFEKTPTDAH
eukprot:TRINITY_DN2072_c0_g1_i1.p1 TRINITY_DN2072_c0_g1~~TRINITY_DN2072_c0_g1_i1.p1  ORF type:complete len:426 (+),score=82.55 TRINITY_DN2072_c0_g1_i1:798-2075(+)